MDFYVKTVPFSRWWTKPLFTTENTDTFDEEIPLFVVTNDKTIAPFVNVTSTPVIAASTAAVVAACCSQVMDANRRINKRKQNVLAQANEINGAAVAAGITPAYTPP